MKKGRGDERRLTMANRIPKSLRTRAAAAAGSPDSKEPRLGTSTAVGRASKEDASPELTIGAARQAANQRLMDSLLHDVRNPLNALSINLDVLTEKIRREHGEIPAAQ